MAGMDPCIFCRCWLATSRWKGESRCINLGPPAHTCSLYTSKTLVMPPTATLFNWYLISNRLNWRESRSGKGPLDAVSRPTSVWKCYSPHYPLLSMDQMLWKQPPKNPDKWSSLAMELQSSKGLKTLKEFTNLEVPVWA